jgi:hypothetical protein
MAGMKRSWFGWMLIGASGAAFAGDVSEIELRRLFAPAPAELAAETEGRIYIYDGVRDTDVERALEEEFERVDSMMFIRTKVTDDSGDVREDPETGIELVADDGC